jgi:hypothetical protein
MQPMPGLAVIRNARVFDSESARLGSASDVYLLRGRIAAVLPAGSPSRGAGHEIDAGGHVLTLRHRAARLLRGAGRTAGRG